MIKRTFYTAVKGLQYYRAICRAKCNGVSHISGIPLVQLREQGIKAIALDFDGVLNYHGAKNINSDAQQLISQALKIFGAHKVFILSNKPTGQRQQYFASHYPEVTFIGAPRKKPYPDGLINIARMAHCDTREIALLDDRLLTGVLACIIAGAHPIYLSKPFVNYSHDRTAEIFFQILRKTERIIF